MIRLLYILADLRGWWRRRRMRKYQPLPTSPHGEPRCPQCAGLGTVYHEGRVKPCWRCKGKGTFAR